MSTASNRRKELAALLEQARAVGWTVDPTANNHWQLKHDCGALLHTGGTPQDHHAIPNLRSQIRRYTPEIDQPTSPAITTGEESTVDIPKTTMARIKQLPSPNGHGPGPAAAKSDPSERPGEPRREATGEPEPEVPAQRSTRKRVPYSAQVEAAIEAKRGKAFTIHELVHATGLTLSQVNGAIYTLRHRGDGHVALTKIGRGRYRADAGEPVPRTYIHKPAAAPSESAAAPKPEPAVAHAPLFEQALRVAENRVILRDDAGHTWLAVLTQLDGD